MLKDGVNFPSFKWKPGHKKLDLSQAQNDALLAEIERQNLTIARLSELALQASHDIRSPLAALRVMATSHDTMPVDMRETLKQIASRVNLIADTLTQAKALGTKNPGSVTLESCLVLPVLESVLSRQRIACAARLIKIELDVEKSVTFALIALSKEKLEVALSAALERVMANLQPESKIVTVSLRLSEGSELGKSRSAQLVMVVEDGRDLALMPPIYFPYAETPSWLATQNEFFWDDQSAVFKKVVVIDDEASMISIWKDTFGPETEIEYYASPGYFLSTNLQTQSIAAELCQTTLYLIDFEFRGESCGTVGAPHDELNGLQLIQNILNKKYPNSISREQILLVTSRHDDEELQGQVGKLGIKLLPKAMAPFLGELLYSKMTSRPATPLSSREKIDFVLIDDDVLIREVWKQAAKHSGQRGLFFDSASSAQSFLGSAQFIAENGLTKSTPIFVDFSLSPLDLSAREILESLHQLGYEELYVATGHDPSHPAVVSLFDLNYLGGILGKSYPQNHITVIQGVHGEPLGKQTESEMKTPPKPSTTSEIYSSFITTCILFILCLTLPFSGCGIPVAEKIGAAPNPNATVYHQARVECDGLDLSSSEFTPSALRSLMHCLNSNGQIPKLEAFFATSRDEELTPLSQTLSRDLLTQYPRLFEVKHTLDTLRDDGSLALQLDTLGEFLEHPDLIIASVKLLEEGYFTSEGGISGYVHNLISPTPNQNVLRALEFLGQELTHSRLEAFLNFSEAATSTRVFQNIQNHFRTTNPGTPELTAIVFALKEFLAWEISQRTFTSASEARGLVLPLLSSVADGSFWRTADTFLPDATPQWQQNLVKIHESMRSLYLPNGEFFTRLPSFMHELNEVQSHGPLACLSGTANLTGLSPRQVFSELDHLSLREFLTSLMAARPFCEFPSSFLRETATFMDLANSDGAAGLELVIRGMNRSEYLQTSLIHTLSERVHSRALPTDSSALRLLETIVKGVETQGAWDDLLLLSSNVKIQDREDLSRLAQVLVSPREEFQGKSVAHILLSAVTKTSVAHWVDFINATKPLIDESQPMAHPLAQHTRSAFLRTAAHPFFDLIRQNLTQAVAHEPFFTATFKILGRNQNAFSEVLRELSGLARREDGRLQEFLFSLLNVFSSATARGRHDIATHPVSPLDLTRYLRHDLIDTELQRAGALPRRVRRPEAILACRNYDFQFSFVDFNQNDFSSRIENMAQCLALYEDNSRVLPALEFFSRERSPALGGSLLNYTVNVVRSFANATQNTLAALMARVLPEIQNGTIARLTSAFHFFLGHQRSESAVDPLLSLVARSQTRAEPQVTPPAETISTPVRVCNLVGNFDDFTTAEMDCSHSYPAQEAISRALAIWEPETSANPALKAQRTQEIIFDYLHAIEHDFHSVAAKRNQGGRLLTDQNPSEEIAKQRISTLLQALETRQVPAADPQGHDKYQAAYALIDILKSLNPSFTPFGSALRPQAFPTTSPTHEAPYREQSLAMADRLASFLIEQANTLTVIPYYFLGEVKPKVILLNNLDWLTLIVEPSDALVNTSFPPAIFGLYMIPTTWDEAPEDQRPGLLQDPNDSGDLPPSHDIHALVTNFLTGIGDPLQICRVTPQQIQNPGPDFTDDKRVCFSKVSNLRGFRNAANAEVIGPPVTSLFLEYAPANAACDESPTACFGMKLIRNFYSLIYQYTPADLRKPFPRRPHSTTNLLTPADLFRTGIMRIAGKWLRGLNPNDVRVKQILRSGAILAHDQAALNTLHELVPALLQHAEIVSGQWESNGSANSANPRGFLRALFDAIWNLPENKKQMLLNMLSSLLQAGPSTGLMETPTNVIETSLQVTKGLLHPAGGRRLLTENLNPLLNAFSTPFYRNLFAEITEDSMRPHAAANANANELSLWHAFRDRYLAGRAHRDYPRAEVDRVTNEVIAFLEHPEGANENHRHELYQSLASTLVHEMTSGRAQELLKFMGAHPQEVDDLLRSADLLYTSGASTRLMDMLGRWIRLVPQASPAMIPAAAPATTSTPTPAATPSPAPVTAPTPARAPSPAPNQPPAPAARTP